VVSPAELRALAREDARALEAKPRVIDVAGDRVELATQLGDPPRVRDIDRDDVELHRHTDRRDHFGIGERAVRILEHPHVLTADDVDVQRATTPVTNPRYSRGWVRGRTAGMLDRRELGEREHGKEDD
jgi:hypothetical protein